MNHPSELDLLRYRRALDAWREDCKRRMALRYPLVEFDANDWPLRTRHGGDIIDFRLTEPLADFAGKDPSFVDALRCVAAERVLGAKTNQVKYSIRDVRLLSAIAAQNLFELDNAALRSIENMALNAAHEKPSSASGKLEELLQLSRDIDLLTSKGVLPFLRFNLRHETQQELLAIQHDHQKRWRAAKAAVLDHRIEALNEAFNALLADHPLLSAADKVAIAMMGLEMCAPSRVNEILCLAIDDHVTIDDYVRRSEDKELDGIHAAHQMLLVTMKGSKGAQWSPKPVLNFMIDFFHYCLKVVKNHGNRSRMLVEWYQQNPDKLYLTPELEYLRGRDISRDDLSKILRLDTSRVRVSMESTIFAELRHAVRKAPNPNGRVTKIDVLPWSNVESHLLDLVRVAMAKCRAVTELTLYKGDLSKMLFLFDHLKNTSPCFPQAVNYSFIRKRLKRHATITWSVPTLFENLGITMPVDGKIKIAEIDTHDPRRWLTTMAKHHGNKLSDVLINKWANRLKLSQLKTYDFNTPEWQAEASAMPDMQELRDLSKGLAESRRMEEECGLKPEIVTVHDAGVSVTSMNAICTASENRPVARTAEQIIVMYPSWFGMCTHQHHENPCRAYSSCLPCNDNTVVKGHLPTNERVRERKDVMHRAIVAQLENLIVSRNRGIADDDHQLSRHILALVGDGLDPSHMADWLIDHFHSIKDQIQDVGFRTRLEEAFVSKGFVLRLDDPDVPSGAQIKYHNPTRHAAPGLERAVDAHGGRQAIEEALEEHFKIYPQFAPQEHGLKDQRDLLPQDDDDDGEETGDNDE
ncbi:hypothetical protein [Sideroxydans sp. CL21]|uniref:hypothetical protein n=1 Tax=Sideroxydans sp. CL21 TaxID=2600596 RepID=UPI0024BCB90D|nr:hypothetical protein [Sideroxydans sp. CL21]